MGEDDPDREPLFYRVSALGVQDSLRRNKNNDGYP